MDEPTREECEKYRNGLHPVHEARRREMRERSMQRKVEQTGKWIAAEFEPSVTLNVYDGRCDSVKLKSGCYRKGSQ